MIALETGEFVKSGSLEGLEWLRWGTGSVQTLHKLAGCQRQPSMKESASGSGGL